MRNEKTDGGAGLGGGAGLQEWLSYQSRTAAAVHPETDVVDWDEGMQVQEERLPRELCEQRLREEVERHSAAPTQPVMTPMIELPDVEMEQIVRSSNFGVTVITLTEVDLAAAGAEAAPVREVAPPEIREAPPRETSTREIKSAAPPIEESEFMGAEAAFLI